MVRRFGQPMEVDNPIAELCGYGTVSGAGFVCETCWNIFPANDAPYGCPVCNAPTTAPDEGQDAPEEVQEEGQDDLASRLQPLDAEDPTGGLAGEEDPTGGLAGEDAGFQESLAAAEEDEQQQFAEEDQTGGLAGAAAGENGDLEYEDDGQQEEHEDDLDDGALVEENLNKISNPPF